MNSDDKTSPQVSTFVESTEFRELPVGTRVELASGALAEVVGNAGDGAWLMVRIVSASEDQSEVGSEEMVFFTDIAGRC